MQKSIHWVGRSSQSQTNIQVFSKDSMGGFQETFLLPSTSSFSECFYPEQLTAISAYIFILVPCGNQTHNPGSASTMLYQLSHTGPSIQRRLCTVCGHCHDAYACHSIQYIVLFISMSVLLCFNVTSPGWNSRPLPPRKSIVDMVILEYVNLKSALGLLP